MTATTEQSAAADSKAFQYAEWALVEKGDERPMHKLIERLEASRTVQQYSRAKGLLSEHADSEG